MKQLQRRSQTIGRILLGAALALPATWLASTPGSALAQDETDDELAEEDPLAEDPLAEEDPYADELGYEFDDEATILDEERPVEEADDTTIAATIADLTDIYLTKQKRRDPLERIIVDGPRAEIWFLQALRGTPQEQERLRCQAFRWLFFGRLTRSQGVNEVFQRFPNLAEVRLSYFTIETRVKPDGRRGYRQYRKADPTMEITISRETAAAVDLVALKEKLSGPQCVAEGERSVDKKWYAAPEDEK